MQLGDNNLGGVSWTCRGSRPLAFKQARFSAAQSLTSPLCLCRNNPTTLPTRYCLSLLLLSHCQVDLSGVVLGF